MEVREEDRSWQAYGCVGDVGLHLKNRGQLLKDVSRVGLEWGSDGLGREKGGYCNCPWHKVMLVVASLLALG